MAVQMDLESFDRLVDVALAQIPEDLARHVSNCLVLVEDTPPSGEPDLLGLYEGVPLPERDSGYRGDVPDRVWIYRLPILARCRTQAEVVDEIRTTVVHEIGHYFGLTDERLHELGWA